MYTFFQTMACIGIMVILAQILGIILLDRPNLRLDQSRQERDANRRRRAQSRAEELLKKPGPVDLDRVRIDQGDLVDKQYL